METIIYGWDRERGQSSLLLGPVAFITILSFLKFCSVSLEEWNELLVLYSLGFFNEKVHKKKGQLGETLAGEGKKEDRSSFNVLCLIADYEHNCM